MSHCVAKDHKIFARWGNNTIALESKIERNVYAEIEEASGKLPNKVQPFNSQC